MTNVDGDPNVYIRGEYETGGKTSSLTQLGIPNLLISHKSVGIPEGWRELQKAGEEHRLLVCECEKPDPDPEKTKGLSATKEELSLGGLIFHRDTPIPDGWVVTRELSPEYSVVLPKVTVKQETLQLYALEEPLSTGTLKTRIYVDGTGDVHIKGINEASLIMVGGTPADHVFVRSNQKITFYTWENGQWKRKFYINSGSSRPFEFYNNNGDLIAYLENDGDLFTKGGRYYF